MTIGLISGILAAVANHKTEETSCIGMAEFYFSRQIKVELKIQSVVEETQLLKKNIKVIRYPNKRRGTRVS